MLENIKLMLGIVDDKHDAMIMLYLAKYETVVVAYTGVSELNGVLRSFIEDKVVNAMKSVVSGGTQNTGEIKSVSRGDTRIDYNVGEASTDTSKGAILTNADRKYLNSFKPTSWRLL